VGQVIRGKRERGRSAQIVIYDVQGTPLTKQFLDEMEVELNRFLNSSSEGKTKAITMVVE